MRNQWCDRKFRGQGLGQEHSQLLDKQHSTTPRALRHQHSWLFALAVRWPRADISAQLSKLMKLILIRLVTWHVVQSEYGANPSKYFLHNGCNLLHISANYLNLTIKWFYWIIWLTWSYIWHRIHGLICLPSSIATTTATATECLRLPTVAAAWGDEQWPKVTDQGTLFGWWSYHGQLIM